MLQRYGMHWQLQCAVKIEGLSRVDPLLDGERILSLGRLPNILPSCLSARQQKLFFENGRFVPNGLMSVRIPNELAPKVFKIIFNFSIGSAIRGAHWLTLLPNISSDWPKSIYFLGMASPKPFFILILIICASYIILYKI